MRLLSLAVAAFALVPHAVEAKCEMWGIAPDVLASTSVVVVGYEDERHGTNDPGDVAVRPDWRFRDAGKEITPKIETLAPGLAVYRLPASATGTVTLEDGAKATVATLISAKPAGLAAPRVKKLVLDQRINSKRPYARVDIELDDKVPDRAVALILADAAGKPLSWGRVTAGATSVRVLDDARCRTLPNGTAIPKANQKVRLFWVDDTGVKSPAGRAAVTAGKTDDGD